MKISFYQETAVPAAWQAGAVYFIKPTTPPAGAPADYMEIYSVDHSGAVQAHTPAWGDIDSLITSRIAASSGVTVVNTIAERDAIASPTGYVYVKDAGADTTVTSGGAEYLYDPATSTWIKVAESESMDLVLNWSSITDAPALADVNAAIAQSHTHANKTQLDKVGEDANGNMTYGGNPVTTQWTTNGW